MPCHCALIAAVLFATAGRFFFQLQPLNVDFVHSSLFIYCKQRIFVVSHFKGPSPPSTFCLWKPWVVVRSLQSQPGWPAPSPASKPDADEKFMTVCLEKPHIPFEVLLLHWCCPHWYRLCLPPPFDQRFFSTVGGQIAKRGWDGVQGVTLLHWYSLITSRFFLAVCNKTLISCCCCSHLPKSRLCSHSPAMCLHHFPAPVLVLDANVYQRLGSFAMCTIQ